MKLLKTIPIAWLLAFSIGAGPTPAQDGPEQKPNVFLQNDRPRNEKESNTRIIDGSVRDASDNPLSDAIVQLKNTKTSNVVTFSTKDDGKYVFRDLPMDINFELVAKRGELATTVRKVSVFDTRKHVIVNFQLAAAKP